MEWDAVYRYSTAKWVYGYGPPLHVLGLLRVREGSLLALFGSGIGKTALIAVMPNPGRALLTPGFHLPSGGASGHPPPIRTRIPSHTSMNSDAGNITPPRI
jgi:hypothetical protein